MKKLILFIVMIFGLNMLYAQTSTDPVYLILSANASGEEGITKYIRKIGRLDRNPSMSYWIESKSRGIYLTFQHFDYNITELAEARKVRAIDQMGILTKSVSFLKTITPIDLDVLFPSWTKEQALAFRDSLQGKKVYIIDRNDIKNDTVKLIEVSYLKPISF